MPIPLIVAGVAAGLIGLGGHASAQETNERAQEISQEAKNMYDNAKMALEQKQKATELSLKNLGYTKKNVLDTSIEQFLRAYDRVKDVNIADSIGLDELGKFEIDPQEALQLREMSDIYGDSLASGATGVAAGAIIALAASGSLPIVTGTLSIAGSALAMGEVGLAAELAGSALSFGAAMTPLAAVAAPVVLFTGISASMKADENLEKAQTMRAQAEEAVEKMALAETLCSGISQRSDMFDSLLKDLNGMFSVCTALLDAVTQKRMASSREGKIQADDLTQEEVNLIAVTRSLAGAVKAVIDTPILMEDGSLSYDSQVVYTDTVKALPAFEEKVAEVKSYKYRIPRKAKSDVSSAGNKSTVMSNTPGAIQNVTAVFLSFLTAFLAYRFSDGDLSISLIGFGAIMFLVMKPIMTSKYFICFRALASLTYAVGFGLNLYQNCSKLIDIRYFIPIDLGLLAVFVVILGLTLQRNENFIKFLARTSVCVVFYAIALMVVKALYGWINVSFDIAILIAEVIYMLFALGGINRINKT